ncbi:hypothetical protein CLIB1423_01S07514 [[Candida] railenensis]|uniref:Telomere length regulation protein conserved domain-containing protein n=1 Tax=[Candida] railenensis TaxID=45579 RepID=A0A9P0VWD6_9ASCO|nr:hypothetical protein CLIB1423_01S07514 [[Candida] railenensis]
MSDSVTVLKNKPSTREIERILTNRIDSAPTFQLSFVTALLDYTVPEAYLQLPLNIQILVVQSLRTVIGIGNIVSRLQKRQSQKSNNPIANGSQLADLYLLVLKSVLFDGGDDLILDLITQSKPIEIKELDKLVFKGKCYSTVNELYIDGLGSEVTESFTFDKYTGFLCQQILAVLEDGTYLKQCSLFINSLFSFHGSRANGPFYTLMFSSENWSYFLEVYKTMKPFEKRAQVKRLVLGYLQETFLRKTNAKSKLLSLYSILHSLNCSDFIDDQFLELVIPINSPPLNCLVSLIANEKGSHGFNLLVRYLMGSFADISIIKSEPITLQASRTSLLISFIQKLDRISVADLSKSIEFLDAISNRLGSFSNNVKSLGVVLADKVCELSGQEKIFKLNDLEGYENLGEEFKIDLSELRTKIDISEAWKLLIVQEDEDGEEESNEKAIASLSKNINQLTANSIDSDDESSSDDDDPTISHKKRIAAPLYVKDLLTYISVDPVKDDLALEKRRLALKSAPVLLRQKASFGTEISFYADDLAENFIAMTNHFDEEDFDSLILNAMISVIVACPKATIHLAHLLSTGDYSLRQRMTILSSISLAARELKGFKDDVVANSYQNKLQAFPSKQLPERLHKAFVPLSSADPSTSAVELVEKSIQDDLIERVSNDFQELSAGKILRISKKLKKDKNNLSPSPLVPNFSKIIGPQFFYPLANVWHASTAGSQTILSIGHYSSILSAHFIKTLTLLMHCAYPNSTQLNDMIRELFSILTPLTMHINPEHIQLTESIVTGYLLIFDIVDTQYLVTTYQDDLSIIQGWLTESWESIIDERIKSLTAGLLLRLNQILESNERLILDQVNSLY